MKDDGGWTRSYRRKWRNPVFRNFRDAAVWSFLTDNAAWQDDTDIRFEGRRVSLKAGQVAVSERYLAEGFCCDRQVIRRIFDALETDLMITREKTHGTTIITICNYTTYQGYEEEEKPTAALKQTHVEPSSNPNIKEPNESKKETTAVDGRAEWAVVGNRVIDMLGLRDDPRFLGNATPAEVWINWGADPELHVYPVIERALRRWAVRAQGPPVVKSIAIFNDDIAASIEASKRPMPETPIGTAPRNKPARPTAEDDQRAILGALDIDASGGLGTARGDTAGPIIDNDPFGYWRGDRETAAGHG